MIGGIDLVWRLFRLLVRKALCHGAPLGGVLTFRDGWEVGNRVHFALWPVAISERRDEYWVGSGKRAWMVPVRRVCTVWRETFFVALPDGELRHLLVSMANAPRSAMEAIRE